MKLQEYFLCAKENKNNFIQQYILFHSSLRYAFTQVLRMHVLRLVCKHVTWTILMMSLLSFWALNVSVALLTIQGQKALRFNQEYLNLCSEDEWRFYGFGTIWGWVIHDGIFVFGWTITLRKNITASKASPDWRRFWTRKLFMACPSSEQQMSSMRNPSCSKALIWWKVDKALAWYFTGISCREMQSSWLKC